MDKTRVDRAAPPREHQPTPKLAAPVDEPTRLKAAAPIPPRGLSYEERLALFTHSLAKANAAALLEGLSRRPRERAAAYLTGLLELPSSERHGRLAAEFGVRPDAPEQLRALWAEASPALRREIYLLLPPYHRSLFPDYVPPPPPAPGEAAPLLRPFAERLVREATR